MAVVQEAGVGAAHRTHQEVQPTVSVNVGKYRPGRALVRTSHARVAGHILEFPAAQIAIERVGSAQIAQIDVAKTITIIVAQRDSRTIKQVLVQHRATVGKRVGELNTGGLAWHQNKSVPAGGRHGKLSEATAGAALPLQLTGSQCRFYETNQRGQGSEPGTVQKHSVRE